MILAICGYEPNAGRTTVATNLAAMNACAGRETLLIDACANQDASRIFQKRTRDDVVDPGFCCYSAPTPLTSVRALERIASHFSQTIVDTDQNTAAEVASQCDHLLFINGPCWDDYIRDKELEELFLKDRNEWVSFRVINRTYPKFKLKSIEFGDPKLDHLYKLTNRQAFSECMRTGVAVIEITNPNDVDPISSREILKLYNDLYDPFEMKKPDRERRLTAIDLLGRRSAFLRG
jgi:hypothetical protein